MPKAPPLWGVWGASTDGIDRLIAKLPAKRAWQRAEQSRWHSETQLPAFRASRSMHGIPIFKTPRLPSPEASHSRWNRSSGDPIKSQIQPDRGVSQCAAADSFYACRRQRR